MIPYKITIVLNEKTKDIIHIESNEKPFKGEIYTIQDVDGKIWEAKITEVVKMIIRNANAQDSIEYRCKAEKHEAAGNIIGFGKRV